MVNNSDVSDMTYDMTRHDNAGTFVLFLLCMSSYNVAKWWMSLWCITTSPPHGRKCRVFDGNWFTRCCVHTLLLACNLACLTWSYIREHIPSHSSFVHPFVHLKTHLHMVFHLWKHLLTCIVCSCICEHVLLHVLSLFIPYIVASCLFMYLYCSHSWWDNIKSTELLVYHDAWSFQDVGDWERGQGYETKQGNFQDGMWAPRTIDENNAEVNGRWRQTF